MVTPTRTRPHPLEQGHTHLNVLDSNIQTLLVFGADELHLRRKRERRGEGVGDVREEGMVQRRGRLFATLQQRDFLWIISESRALGPQKRAVSDDILT